MESQRIAGVGRGQDLIGRWKLVDGPSGRQELVLHWTVFAVRALDGGAAASRPATVAITPLAA